MSISSLFVASAYRMEAKLDIHLWLLLGFNGIKVLNPFDAPFGDMRKHLEFWNSVP